MDSSRSKQASPEASPEISPEISPWWRHGMVWLVISGPAAVIAGGVATLVIALTHPDPVLPTTATPAVQARNHAVTPK